ncbi:MAG: dinitrogenase iron-molybdenum cofactor biosynthesis protein [Clostridiales bacterium]|jgi:predicted Fe-Mo cluster-binding NifX family protein|nr:dinitrogenase iron-molybdenum cofactor biosynthesis protein [Clostridiales bacterium]
MKICITSSGETIESALDPRFGRCSYFIIADLESGEHSAVANEAVGFGGGAGISSGQLVAEKGVTAVITGNVGPNALKVLKTAGIEIFRGTDATVKENIERYKAGGLEKITENVPSHFGMKNRG